MRTCYICKLEKDDSEFYKDKSRTSGYHPYCKVCQRPIKYRNKALCMERAAKWNKENKERRKKIKRKWYDNNLELVRFYNATRRIRKSTLSDGTVTKEALCNLPKNVCGICNEYLDFNAKLENGMSAVHLDHIVPLILGGAHSITNLQWTHSGCNLSSGGRLKTGRKEKSRLKGSKRKVKK